ncbi:18332_t:CDS:2, partial [Racocetra persica]
ARIGSDKEIESKHICLCTSFIHKVLENGDILIVDQWNLVPTYKFISSNGTVEGSTLIETPDESTNLFTMFSTSILAVYFMLTVDELKKYVKSVEDKNSLPSKILEISKIDDFEKELKDSIKELKDSVKELKDSMKELKNN